MLRSVSSESLSGKPDTGRNDEPVFFSRITWVTAEGFQLASWHCIRYCPNAIPLDVLFMLHRIQQLLVDFKNEGCDGAPPNSSWVSDGEIPRQQGYNSNSLMLFNAAELLLRLCLRKRSSFRLSQLHSWFGAHLSVTPETCEILSQRFVLPGKVSGSEMSEAEGVAALCSPFISVFSGRGVFSLLFHYSSFEGPDATKFSLKRLGATVLRTSGAQQLRQVASTLVSMRRQFHDRINSGARKSSTSFLESPLETRGPPTQKEELVSFLLTQPYGSMCCQGTGTIASREDVLDALASSWDHAIGPIVVLNPHVKRAVNFISSVFHIITNNFSYATSMFARYTPTTVTPVPTLILDWNQRVVVERQTVKQVVAHHTIIEKNTEGEQGGGAHVVPEGDLSWSTTFENRSIPVHLFSSIESLSCYLRGVHLHDRIYRVTDGARSAAQRFVGKDKEFVMAIYNDVISLLGSLQDVEGAIGLKELEEMTGIVSLGESKDTDVKEHRSIVCHLYRSGLLASHLLQFTPQYRLYACLELLIPLLEYLKCYTEAIKSIRLILFRPLFIIYPLSLLGNEKLRKADRAVKTKLVSNCPSAFKFFYRWEKRGFWFHRLAMNYSHVKEMTRALNVLKEAHQRWHEIVSLSEMEKKALLRFTAVNECEGLQSPVKEERNCLPSLHRRARMLKGLWAGALSCSAVDQERMSLFHAASEYLLERYCRSSDMLSIEKSLCAIFRKVYRWTPLPESMQATTSKMLPAPTLVVRGVQDVYFTKGWRDPERQHSGASSVESMVLNYFLDRYNQKVEQPGSEKSSEEEITALPSSECLHEEGDKWMGLHCEGQWIALLSRILLWDCFYHSQVHTPSPNMGPIWLSQLQNEPLDKVVPLLFEQRRQHIIEERLLYLEALSKEDFLSLVRKQCHDLAMPCERITHKRARDDDAAGNQEDVEDLPAQASFSSASSFLTNFPLVEVVNAIPQQPLIELLRCMFLRTTLSGFSSSFSGFPDLILWSRQAASGEEKSKCHFKLLEVKSPHDELSTKQIAVNDTLLRCGFEVYVVRVEAVGAKKES